MIRRCQPGKGLWVAAFRLCVGTDSTKASKLEMAVPEKMRLMYFGAYWAVI